MPSLAPQAPAQTYVLDATALLVLARGERGAAAVADYLDTYPCVVCAINLAEVGSKLIDLGLPEAELPRALKQLNVEVVDVGYEHALRTSALRAQTSAYALSLGARSCLALAQQLGGIAVTTDPTWQALADEFGFAIVQIR